MPPRVLWLPRWLGSAYAKLYGAYGDDLFTFEHAAKLAGNGNAKLVVSLLRRKGWLSVFGRNGRKRSYRLLKPDLATYSFAHGAAVIPKQGRYSNLLAILPMALRKQYGNRLRSVAVFGSIGRGSAGVDSDMDVLVVGDFHGDIASRIDELSDVEFSGETDREITWLRTHGVRCHISWFPLTYEEALRFRPIYLDMTEDAMIIYDGEGLLTQILTRLRRTLKRKGAKRVWLDKARWYWTLGPDIGREMLVKV